MSIPESVIRIGDWAFEKCPATIICHEDSPAHLYCAEKGLTYIFDYQYEAFHGLLPSGFEKLASPFLADEEGSYVFVSYSHRDRELVLPVIKELYESGWRIWYDEGLTIGDSYDETLEAHVRGCSAFLLFVTERSRDSLYIRDNEVPWAVRYGKPIVECALEGQERYEIDGGSAAAEVAPSGIVPALERIEGLVKGAPREARGITVVVDPAARDVAVGGGYACCLYSEDGAAAAKAIMLEARRAGCALYDAVEEGMDPERIVGCACLVAFLDRAFLEDGLLAGILSEFYRAGREIAVCALGGVEDVELPEGLAGLDKEHWLVYSHGIKADLNTQLARHLQRLGCRDASVLPGFEYEETEEGIVITKYEGVDPAPRIERAYGGVPVVAIADRAFEYCVLLKEVAIPGSVTEIGELAFSGCANLTTIHIPYGITTIGNRTFDGCASLTSIDIPDTVTKIGWRAFHECKSLASIDIPASVTELGDEVCYGCTGLSSVDIPDEMTQIAHGAFRDCASLSSVDIPDCVTTIGDAAFSGCASLTSVDIPDGVTKIGEHAFSDCTRLISVTIPDGVTEVGTCTFSGCTSLTSIDLPSCVTLIGPGAFNGCGNLTTIDIPDGVTKIWPFTFDGCSRLTTVALPDGVTEIESMAFENCTSLSSIVIPVGVCKIGDLAFSGCNSLSSVAIPDTVTRIGQSAFRDCVSLASIDISNGVTRIGTQVFKGCGSLGAVVIPKSVTDIGYEAFKGCASLTSVDIPDSVTKIDESAFGSCERLTITCRRGSYAWEFCKEHGIPVKK